MVTHGGGLFVRRIIIPILNLSNSIGLKQNLIDFDKNNSRRKKHNSRKIHCKNLLNNVNSEYQNINYSERGDIMMIVWLVLMILFIVVEIATVGLVSIWFAGGALIACLLAMANIHVIIQVVVFLIVSIVLLSFTRPLAEKNLNKNRTKTNYEGIIGKVVRVTERIDNIHGTGTALVNGQEWTARAESDNIILEQGDVAQVVNITGVKLIVKKYED